MNRISLCNTIEKLFFVAVTLSFLISGAIRPLLVQCTPADGETTLELIGRDPHRQVYSGHDCEISKSDPGAAFSLCTGVVADCVDLFLSHTAIMRAGIDAPVPAHVAGAFEKSFSSEASRVFPPSGFLTDPALQVAFPPPFKLSLRI